MSKGNPRAFNLHADGEILIFGHVYSTLDRHNREDSVSDRKYLNISFAGLFIMKGGK